jgi:hypothetical protein
MGEGRGIALPPANSSAIAQPDKAPAKAEPLIVVRDNKQEPDLYQREMENIRRMKLQSQLTALSAPLPKGRGPIWSKPRSVISAKF